MLNPIIGAIGGLACLFLAQTAISAGDERNLTKILDEIYSLHFSSLKCLVVVASREEYRWLPPLPELPKVAAPIISVSLDADDVSALSQGPLSPDAAAAILSEDSDTDWALPPPSASTPALRTLQLARRASCDTYVVFLSSATPDTGLSLVRDGPRSGLLHGTARLLLARNSSGASWWALDLQRALPPTHALTRVAVAEVSGEGSSVRRRMPDGQWLDWKAGEVLFGAGSVPGDLGGRKLVTSTFPYPPFSFVKPDVAQGPTPGSVECWDDNDVPLATLEGTEIRIVRELALRLHFRPCAVLRPNSRWLNHSPNGSLQGVLADVSSRFADIGFAGFYQDAREAPLVDYSAPYTSAGLSFLVPKPRSPAVPRWMALLQPFSPWCWAAVGGTLAASALTIRVLAAVATGVLPAPTAYQRYVRLPDCVLHVASVLAQVGVPMPSGTEGRWPLQWLLPGLNLITYCYSGCLAAYLTLPSPEAPIDTLAELRAAGLPWGARTSYWSLLLLHNWENPDAQVLGRRFRLILDPMALRKGLLSAEIAVAVQTVQGTYVTNAEYLDARGFSQVHLMKETAFEGYASILLPKGSPLTRPTDAVIGRLLAAGLIQRWERELTSSSSTPTSSSISSTPPSSTTPSTAPSNTGPVVLSLEHILGAFLLLFGGLIAASATLLGEVLTAKPGAPPNNAWDRSRRQLPRVPNTTHHQFISRSLHRK
ncbi:uncharacterized protein LOC124164395 [Ischnura elegans]|uniref:uncharacterized protein LOC124164395 n=1 Tax=Ischnura elegans TaxID=197161 RepID=UPI001ED8ABB0|nr:uncharacterized protein LOC124164395 [Ischnura elegans]